MKSQEPMRFDTRLGNIESHTEELHNRPECWNEEVFLFVYPEYSEWIICKANVFLKVLQKQSRDESLPLIRLVHKPLA